MIYDMQSVGENATFKEDKKMKQTKRDKEIV